MRRMLCLGKTLWRHWTSDYPIEEVRLDRIRNLSVRTIIDDCIKEWYQTIKAFCDTHVKEKASCVLDSLPVCDVGSSQVIFE